jgi:hypothetical protein
VNNEEIKNPLDRWISVFYFSQTEGGNNASFLIFVRADRFQKPDMGYDAIMLYYIYIFIICIYRHTPSTVTLIQQHKMI